MTPIPSLVHSAEKASRILGGLPDPVFTYGLEIRSTPPAWDWSRIRSMEESVSDFTYSHTHEGGVHVMDFSLAASHSPALLEGAGSLLREDSPLAMLHLSRVRNGLLVHIPSHVRSEAPILLPSLPLTFSHYLIVAEPHSSVSLILPESHPSHTSFVSTVVEVFAASHSKVSIVSQQTFPLSCVRSSFKRAHVSDHASVDWFWVEHGTAFSISEISSDLQGEESSTQNIGVVTGSDSQIFDLDQSVYHFYPSSKSRLLTRGVLDDSAKCVYRGLLKMTPNAPGSIGNQRADFLLLSPSSEADPVPALEIEGSEVRCSHAATVGRLDREKLFYLSSRGLSEEVARSLYIQGFLEHLLKQFPLHDSMEAVRSCLAQSLDLSSHVDSLGVPEEGFS
ncbi:MAG: SufD family Fe-S cluster assembly protein [archaeon]